MNQRVNIQFVLSTVGRGHESVECVGFLGMTTYIPFGKYLLAGIGTMDHLEWWWPFGVLATIRDCKLSLMAAVGTMDHFQAEYVYIVLCGSRRVLQIDNEPEGYSVIIRHLIVRDGRNSQRICGMYIVDWLQWQSENKDNHSTNEERDFWREPMTPSIGYNAE